MASLLTVDVDASRVLAAFDRLGAVAERHVRAAAKETAERIQTEALARVARRSGRTAEGIAVELAQVGVGYVVAARRQQMPDLPAWLEFGTKFMTARAFFFAPARLEEGPHLRRLAEALQAALDEVSR